MINPPRAHHAAGVRFFYVDTVSALRRGRGKLNRPWADVDLAAVDEAARNEVSTSLSESCNIQDKKMWWPVMARNEKNPSTELRAFFF